MPLSLYNTMTRRKAVFAPIVPGKVGLYTCGLTVYNYAHIGNLRTYVFEDILKRVLRMCGYDVRHVMNVTDVGHLVSDADEGEDKMLVGARREGKSAWEIAEFYWQAFQEDLRRLHVLFPDVWCKATDHIPEQIELVSRLEQKGYTYTIPGDGVYFDTSRLSDYGKLARLDVSGLKAGARIAVVEGKRNPTDFALWKFSPAGAQRQMEWDSPWGVGFPGWHIECAAMAIRYLGERLDIHCGGVDHIPVHHTNEIAQAEAALGHEWVNWWMHGEFLVFPQAEAGPAGKMSKSTGEFLTLDRLVERGLEPLAYRYFCLNAHYRQQLAFSWEALSAAASAFSRLEREVLAIKAAAPAGPAEPIEGYLSDFRAAAEDDLNTPRALAAMWAALKDTDAPKERLYATLLAMDEVLGFGFEQMQPQELEISPEQIHKLLAERAEARTAKDYARADEIRTQLQAQGVVVEDTPEGTVWRRG